jgi:hypothetical protein
MREAGCIYACLAHEIFIVRPVFPQICSCTHTFSTLLLDSSGQTVNGQAVSNDLINGPLTMARWQPFQSALKRIPAFDFSICPFETPDAQLGNPTYDRALFCEFLTPPRSAGRMVGRSTQQSTLSQ